MTTDQDRASEVVAKNARGESVINLTEIDLTKVDTSTLPLLYAALTEGYSVLLRAQANIVKEMDRRRKKSTNASKKSKIFDGYH